MRKAGLGLGTFTKNEALSIAYSIVPVRVTTEQLWMMNHHLPAGVTPNLVMDWSAFRRTAVQGRLGLDKYCM